MVDEFGPKVFKNFPEGRVIAREDIIKDVRSLMETDQVVDFIQRNKSTKASEKKKEWFRIFSKKNSQWMKNKKNFKKTWT